MAFSISPGALSVAESAGKASFTLTRSSTAGNQTVFVSTVENGTANSNDYVALSNQPVTFADGQASQTVSISILNDSVPEANETFGLFVQQNSGDPLSAALAKASFTIVDDGAVAATSWSMTPGSQSVSESAGKASFTLTRASGSGSQTVFVSTVQELGAVNNNDFVALANQPVTFADGQTSQTVTVTVLNDSTPESPETFGLILQQKAGDSSAAALAKASFTILDDDGAAAAGWSVTPGTQSVSESAGTASFTVTRPSGIGSQTVFVSTLQNPIFPNNKDYVDLVNLPVTFADGQTAQTVSVAILNDAVAEQNETFGLVVQQSANDPTTTALAKASFTIVDDDVATAGTSWSISPAGSYVRENAGTVSLTLNRASGTGSQTVFVSTVENPLFANAGDYVALANQAVSFADGQTSLAVTISILNDSVAEPNETFGVVVQQTASAATSAALAKASITILDDDSAPAAGWSVAPATQSVAENAGTLTVTVTRASSAGTATVFLSTAEDLGNQNSGDFVALKAQPLTFADGQTSQTAAVTILDDKIAEANEKFGLVLQATATDPAGTYLAKAGFNILDDDKAAGTAAPGEASLVQLAQMASAAYDATPRAIDGFTVVDTRDGAAGFHAVEFQSGKTIVLAIRGVAAAFDAFNSATADLASAGTPTADLQSEVAQAAALVASLRGANPDAKILLTGHSLGGAIAQLVANSAGLSSRVFDTPNLMPLKAGLADQLSLAGLGGMNGNDSVDIRLYGDALSLLGNTISHASGIGTIKTLASPIAAATDRDPGGSFLANDAIGALLGQLQAGAALTDGIGGPSALDRFLTSASFSSAVAGGVASGIVGVAAAIGGAGMATSKTGAGDLAPAVAAGAAKLATESAQGFDPVYYLLSNPDVAAAGMDPLAHYQAAGAKEGRVPNQIFDKSYYLAANPDIAAAHADPFQHYEQFGWKEGRDPSAGFSSSGYLAANPDVKLAGVNPLDHYVANGIAEGRLLS